MLNPFPELLTFTLMAPFLLRVVLGLIFLDLGILKFKGEREQWKRSFEAVGVRSSDLATTAYGVIQIVGSILLIIGLWTQIAALAFVLFSGIEFFIEWRESRILKRNITFYILIFVIAFSLLLTGAGAFAVDIPL